MQGLSQYGNGFLAKFEAAACPNQLLEEVTLVDTPGVLSGEKQRIEVCSACASRNQCCINTTAFYVLTQYALSAKPIQFLK